MSHATQQQPMSAGQLLNKASSSSSDLVDSEKNINFTGNDSETIDHEAERKLVWKLDLYMMPLLFYLYMLCFLDRYVRATCTTGSALTGACTL